MKRLQLLLLTLVLLAGCVRPAAPALEARQAPVRASSFTFQPNPFSSSYLLSNSKTMSANNTTANVPIFGITGTVRFLKLFAVVTTTLGANHTSPLFRTNDQTAQIALCTAGSALSAALPGATVGKTGLAATALNVQTANTGKLIEPSLTETVVFSEFVVVQKNGVTTNIEYQYATTDAPTSGVIQFFVEYQLLSAGAAVAAL